ncbi:uncharacterized protein [Prorops nasuta]|uniref:uncharacterized protein n=1 Tax=Prorops nasuta TaxID=863751 RepID=UPI0034CD8B82
MKYSIVLLAMALVSCHAMAYDSGMIRTFANSKLIGFLENFKSIMKTGNDTLGIPVLDPFKLAQQSFKLENEFITVDALLTALQVDSLSNYKVKDADFAVSGLKLFSNFTWDEIKAKSGYVLDGLIAKVYPIYGHGEVSIALSGFDVDIALKLGVRDKHLYVKEMSIHAALKCLRFHIYGLFDDESVSELISAALSDMIPQLLEDYQKELMEPVADYASNMLNERLKTMSFTDLIGMIVYNMKCSIVLLAIAFVCCQALPYNEDHIQHEEAEFSLMTNKFRNFLENFKKTMKTGNKNMRLPVLDPYKQSKQAFKFENKMILIDALMTQLQVNKLSEYTVKDADLILIRPKLHSNFSWNEINAMTGYDLNGNIAKAFKIFGSGNMKVSLHNLNIYVGMKFRIKNSHLFLMELVIRTSLKDAKIEVTGLFKNEKVSEWISKAASTLIPKLLEKYHDNLIKPIIDYGTNAINKRLHAMSFRDWINIIG